jgi:hypothetical protein
LMSCTITSAEFGLHSYKITAALAKSDVPPFFLNG